MMGERQFGGRLFYEFSLERIERLPRQKNRPATTG
jgi:hypothetical protein